MDYLDIKQRDVLQLKNYFLESMAEVSSGENEPLSGFSIAVNWLSFFAHAVFFAHLHMHAAM